MKGNRTEIKGQLIAVMAHVETVCEERGLIAPIDVTITNFDGN